MTDTTVTIPPALQFPKYTYTFTVLSLNFDSSTILVEFTPTDTRFTKITLALPIMANFNLSSLETYVETWAPHQKWFAQEIMLNHGDALIGASSNITAV